MTKKLLVIGFVWPEPKSSAAGTRILQLILQFQNQGFEVTFSSAAKTSDNTFDLNTINVETRPILLNDSSFDVFVKDLNPDVVLFDRFMTEEQYGWRVEEQCPNTIRVLDTEDFHGLRKAREVALKQNETVSVSHLQNDITKREIASIYRCDLSLIISEAEIDILTNQFKIDKNLLYYLPFLLDPISDLETKHLPTFEERHHFVTIGNFLHAPNYDAVLYLKQTIWPLVRQQLPKAELHIYGSYESQKVAQLNKSKEGFLIKGFAEDVNEVMQNAKVCFASLRFGAGLKGKLVDAMQNGTPCVMTRIAAEGMFGDFGENGFIADKPETFAEKAVALYTKAELWQEKQQNGFAILNQRFNKTDFQKAFTSKIIELSTHLNAHRENNFIGQLFMHQSMQSSKYMSKWIEAKNK
ncbi:glycosyltransferase involved in cell wall biosynthesis [Winogradskyella pacifica]|uniref:Glycosyltransferase involved in cell wall biosynthesis n=1 Tax=Winogradskyella pacifica TaxID=664642 RepID=A0A3D9N067_9FLAO|nr:glycosyltransferase [Winogradskyella pacifica]REE24954.1 glycosyltransferase involved in cell wall biosynthesis [Winogradskyella pacifica]